jgi:hypothetical protein
VPVYVNDKGPYDFILDTGCSGSVIAGDLAKDLDIVAQHQGDGITIGGEIKTAFANIKSLAVAEAKVENLHVGIQERSI